MGKTGKFIVVIVTMLGAFALIQGCSKSSTGPSKNFVVSFLEYIKLKFFPAAVSGDTPVVLIGDSLKNRAKYAGIYWVQVSSTVYKIIPSYTISSIALKQSSSSSGSGDEDTTTDILNVDVAGASWQVDEYTASLAPQPVVTLSNVVGSNQINLTLNNTSSGLLCPKINSASHNIEEVQYYEGITTCPTPPSAGPNVAFSQVNLTVTIPGHAQVSGTLTCNDSTSTVPTGVCRIAFRGPLH